MFAVNLLFIYWPRVEPDLGRQTDDCQVSTNVAYDQDIVSGLQDDDSGFFLSANFHISCLQKKNDQNQLNGFSFSNPPPELRDEYVSKQPKINESRDDKRVL